jgi:hypothetical protein
MVDSTSFFQAMSGCKKFRLVRLENKEDLEIMFSGATCTNASAMAPGTNEGLDGANSDNDDVEEVPHFADCDKQVRKGSSAHKSSVKNQRRILETCSSSVLLIPL